MLIFYRFIPFLAGLLCAAALGLAIVAPDWFLPAMGALLLALAFLYARLIDLPKHDFGFWNSDFRFIIMPNLPLICQPRTVDPPIDPPINNV